MHKHFVTSATLALLTLLATQAFAQTVTLVTRSGDRVPAQLVDVGNRAGFTARIGGRDREIPMEDVAVIDFVGNGRNMTRTEQDRASRAGDNGLVVLRNGRSVAGRLVDMQRARNVAVVSDNAGERTVPLNQVARIYLGANGYGSAQYWNNDRFGPNARNGGPGRNGGYGYDRNGGQNGGYERHEGQNGSDGRNGSNTGSYGGSRSSGQQNGYGRQSSGVGSGTRTLAVPSNQQWTDGGVDVSRGQTLHFHATGTIQMSENQGDAGTAAGATSGRKAGNSPLPTVTGGTLIGRINNGPPFVVGADSDVTMPADGRLSFGINDDYVGDNKGAFSVQISQQ